MYRASSRYASMSVVFSTWNVSKCTCGKHHVLANVLLKLMCHCRMDCVTLLNRTIWINRMLWKCFGIRWKRSASTLKSIAFPLSSRRKSMVAKRVCHFAFKLKLTLKIRVAVHRQSLPTVNHWNPFMRPPAKSKCSNWKVPIESINRIERKSKSVQHPKRKSISRATNAPYWMIYQAMRLTCKIVSVQNSELPMLFNAKQKIHYNIIFYPFSAAVFVHQLQDRH